MARQPRYFATKLNGDLLVKGSSLRVLLLRLRGESYGDVFDVVEDRRVPFWKLDEVSRELRAEGRVDE